MHQDTEQKLAGGCLWLVGLYFACWIWRGLDGILIASGIWVSLLGCGIAVQAAQRERDRWR